MKKKKKKGHIRGVVITCMANIVFFLSFDAGPRWKAMLTNFKKMFRATLFRPHPRAYCSEGERYDRC